MVETAGDADREAFGGESFDDHRNAIRKRDRHGDGFLGVRTATETVVLVLGSWSCAVILDGRFAATQLRHEQIRRRPRQQEAGHDANNDVLADSAHLCRQGNVFLSQPQIGRAWERLGESPLREVHWNSRGVRVARWRPPLFTLSPCSAWAAGRIGTVVRCLARDAALLARCDWRRRRAPKITVRAEHAAITRLRS